MSGRGGGGSGARWAWGVVGVIVAVGAALRVAGVFDDFWLDEIWSWRIARSVHSAVGVLMSPGARVDNNHPLNTLILYWLGDRMYWPVYRVPAVAAGVGVVILAAWYMGRRWGRVEAVAAAVLLGASYPMVVYSSEARGYAPMVLFAVAGFVALDRFLVRRSWGAAGMFAACAVLGFLSHLTFAHFYLAALVWSAVRLGRGSKSVGVAAVDFVRCHAVPVVFAGWLYWVFARGITIGGAPDTSLWGVVTEALAVMGGGAEAGVVIAVVTAVTILLSLAVVWRHRREWFVFFVVCVVVSPAAFVLMQAVSMRGMETLFPRYFLVSMAFGYLLIATAMGILWRLRGQAAVVVLLAMYALASLWQIGLFLRGTRGHYLEAVEYMAGRSPGRVATVGSDNAFRTRMLLGFYERYLPAGERVVYVSGVGTPPEWFVVNAQQAGVTPAGAVTVGGVPYRFEREFSYYGLSGWSWYVFRRASG